MSKLAVIVDGGYIRALLYTPQDPTNPDKPYGYPDANIIYQKIKSVVSKNLPNEELFRIYYYDCIPDIHESRRYKNPITGELENLMSNIQIENQIKVFDMIKKKPYIAFRYGELAFDGWKIRNLRSFREKIDKSEIISGDDLNIKITQKGVDLKIGIDIAWLAMNKIVDKILIIAGDSDLIPSMKFARKEGLIVCLETLGKGVKKCMIDHSDLFFNTNGEK